MGDRADLDKRPDPIPFNVQAGRANRGETVTGGGQIPGQSVFVDQHEDPARARMLGFEQGHAMSTTGFKDEHNTSRLNPRDAGGPVQMAELARSSIPTSQLSAQRGRIDLETGPTERGVGGYYRPGSTEYARDMKGNKHVLYEQAPEIKVGTRAREHDTVVHEMGHAHHYDTVEKVDRDHPTREYRNQYGGSPDPLKEGIADAHVDRYGGAFSQQKQTRDTLRRLGAEGELRGGVSPQFAHLGITGYSANYESDRGANAAWNLTDRAIYTGTRAHYEETGEIPRYQSDLPESKAAPGFRGNYARGGGDDLHDPVSDATVAYLHQHSEPARRAWGETKIGLHQTELSGNEWAPVEEAVRRHRDRRLLNEGQFTQTSMLLDMKTHGGEHLGYAVSPEAHASEDFEATFSDMARFDDHPSVGQGDVAWPHTLEYNQFGEAPRSKRQIQDQLGVPRSAVDSYTLSRADHVRGQRDAERMQPSSTPSHLIPPMRGGYPGAHTGMYSRKDMF